MGRTLKLGNYIKHLELVHAGLDNEITKYTEQMLALTLYLIGSRTSYDTGVAREFIQKMVAQLGYDEYVSQLATQTYEHWKTVTRRWRDDKPEGYFKKNRNGSYTVIFDDWGMWNQAERGKVSNIHPRGNDPRLVPKQVDFTIDRINTMTEVEFEDELNKIIEKLIKYIE